MTQPDWRPPDPRTVVPVVARPGLPPVRPQAAEPRTTPFAVLHVRWLLLVAVAGLVVLVIAGVLVSRVLGVAVDDGELVSTLLYVPLLGWVLYAAWRHHVHLRAFFRWPRIGRYWWVVLGMTVAVFGFSIGASNITAALFPDYVSAAEVSPSAGALVLVFALAIVPPVVEELIFRGMLLERWAVKWRLGVAIVVQAICFGILHVDPIGAGMFGVVMALMYLRTRSLWPPIAMHALNNGVVVLAVLAVGDAASASEPQPLGEAVVTGLAFMLVAGGFIAVFVTRNWPTARTLTPYEVFQLGEQALPPRYVGAVDVVHSHAGALGRGRLRLLGDTVLVSRDRKGRETLSWAPYGTIAHCGVDPEFRVLDLRAGDGSRLVLSLPQRAKRTRTGIVRAVGDRVRVHAGVEPVWSTAAIG